MRLSSFLVLLSVFSHSVSAQAGLTEWLAEQRRAQRAAQPEIRDNRNVTQQRTVAAPEQAAGSPHANNLPPAQPKQGRTFTWEEAPSNNLPYAPRTEAQCSELKLDQRFFGSPRNQGGMGWCFAYSVADLLSFCVAKNKGLAPGEKADKYQISAFDIALGYAAANWKDTSDQDPKNFLKILNGGGYPYEAMQRMENRGGYCREWDLTSDPESFWYLVQYLGGRQTATPELKALAAEMLKEENSPKSIGHGTMELLQKFIDKRLEYTKTGTLACFSDPDKKCFSKLGVVNPLFTNEGFEALLKRTNNRNFLWELDEALCPLEKREPLPAECTSARTYYPKEFDKYINDGKDGKSQIQKYGHSLFKKIDDVLESGYPVELSIESHFISQPGDNKDTGNHGAHAMVLIGRKFVGGECRYQIRNTWKANWNMAKKEADDYCPYYAKDEKTPNPFVKDCDPKTGYFWTSEDTIRKNVQFIMHLTR